MLWALHLFIYIFVSVGSRWGRLAVPTLHVGNHRWLRNVKTSAPSLFLVAAPVHQLRLLHRSELVPDARKGSLLVPTPLLAHQLKVGAA